MFKVFAFLRRNTALLTHDEYRAGHVGYHCSHSRRLHGIRGYCVNVRADGDLAGALGPLHAELTRDPPRGFDALWDGFPAVHFDSAEAWRHAARREPTRAGPEGLMEDPDWVLTDGPYLFDPAPGDTGEFRSHHLHVEEHAVVPVERPEAKLCKLVQFFRRNPALDDSAFRAGLLGRYAPLAARLAGLRGYTVNLRDPDLDAAIRGFFPPTSWVFGAEGQEQRRAFAALWDGACELYTDSLRAFVAARTAPELHPELCALERHLFAAVWYVEVDESVIVLPNRAEAPDFYYR